MRAFILLDCLWIALLLGFGGYLYREGAGRAALREDAERIRKDLGYIQEALEDARQAESLPAGESVPFTVYGKYLENGSSRLREKGMDPLGNPYGNQHSSGPPRVPAASAESLKEVVGPDFWAPYSAMKPE